MKTLAMNDFDDGYQMPMETFALLAESANTLTEFGEFEVARVCNREGYAPGCLTTVICS